ncbi:MAG: two-component system sensor histidine kinase NtrB [Desulfomonilia bacterium]|jgi:PAS domain S-box-containing protein|uniref:Sporulation kinase A n=1 Tax=anaerobic digester metagenome TaxID=1263854 RepID=A0A485LY62_9ZZZZ|nr:ATP-binding protein [Pseudomonadota bacterium]HON37591.1 ATP-binding protein [Deltaproteobacteria bacterium]HRS55098.1 ATP-binding protein [Desulfomonilia bacterium]HPD21449.1 ATP-binding protein [Deltaproteobacteria bacterium]HPX19479.1 ATP-binding protein [Deltaproteobacteria bacterium]
MARKNPVYQQGKSPVRQAQDALKKSDRHFRDLVEHSLTGISIIQDGRVVYRNPEQQRLFGPLSEDSPASLYDHIHPDDIQAIKALQAELFAGKAAHPGRVVRFYPQGSAREDSDIRWLLCRASLIEHEGREAVLLNMMDVTIARELEHVLIMQDRMTSLGRVAAGIAHEIRNPLSGITIYLHSMKKILAKSMDMDEAFALIDKMLDASRRIDAVIKRVMDFSRPGEPSFSSIDIRWPVEEAISLSAVTLRKSGIAVEIDIPGDLPRCLADPRLIEQVMLNLITNAIEAVKNTPREKKIEVCASSRRDSILIKVGDSGPGIPPARRDRIFDPFFTTKAGNTGIGLCLSHRIITDHGGRLRVGTSRLGGAEFIVSIPVRQGDGRP